VSVPLWIAESRNHDLPLAAVAQVGTALAYDDRLSDWDDAIMVWASAEEQGSEERPWSLLWILTRAARGFVDMNFQASILALTCHT
jgi:hypothetical protein